MPTRKKYLSADLLRDEPAKENFSTSEVELLGFRAFKRVCHMCCDPLECAESLPPRFEAAEEVLPSCPRRATQNAL